VPKRSTVPYLLRQNVASFNPNGLSIGNAQKPAQYKDRAGRAPFQYIRETARPIELAQLQALARRECKSFLNPTMSLETGLYDRSARLTANRMLASYTFISGMQGAFHRPGDISVQ
jgi:hypothetical protein